MLVTIFNSHGDELESESISSSSGSSTLPLHSQEASNASGSSSLSQRRNNNHQRNQLHAFHHDHHSLILTCLLIAGALIVLPLGIIAHLYSNINLGSLKTNETMLSPQISISESTSMKNIMNTKTDSFDELSVVVQPQEVECYGSITLLSLQLKCEIFNRTFQSQIMSIEQLLHNPL